MKAIITLCLTKVIDARSGLPWDKLVFDHTYREYYMQAQQFDQEKKFDTFSQIVANNPRADAMHYLVSTAAKGHIIALNNRFPDVMDSLGKRCIPFEKFRFEIVESSVSNRNLHKIAIFFFSSPLIWIDSISQHQLVIADASQLDSLFRGEEVSTSTITSGANVGIVALKKIANKGEHL